jgi:hypothetical protein
MRKERGDGPRVMIFSQGFESGSAAWRKKLPIAWKPCSSNSAAWMLFLLAPRRGSLGRRGPLAAGIGKRHHDPAVPGYFLSATWRRASLWVAGPRSCPEVDFFEEAHDLTPPQGEVPRGLVGQENGVIHDGDAIASLSALADSWDGRQPPFSQPTHQERLVGLLRPRSCRPEDFQSKTRFS